MDVLTFLLISAGALTIILVLLVLMLAITPERRDDSGDETTFRTIKKEIEDEVMMESVPYRLPNQGKRTTKILPSI